MPIWKHERYAEGDAGWLHPQPEQEEARMTTMFRCLRAVPAAGCGRRLRRTNCWSATSPPTRSGGSASKTAASSASSRPGKAPHEIAVSADQRHRARHQIRPPATGQYAQRGRHGNRQGLAHGRPWQAQASARRALPRRRPACVGHHRRTAATCSSSISTMARSSGRSRSARARGHMVAVSPDGKTAYVSKIEAGHGLAASTSIAGRKTREVASGAGRRRHRRASRRLRYG